MEARRFVVGGMLAVLLGAVAGFWLMSEREPPDPVSRVLRQSAFEERRRDAPRAIVPRTRPVVSTKAGSDTDSTTSAGIGAGLEPAPTYHPRPATEWQGMLVDLANPAYCNHTPDCQRARSCQANACGPCFDSDDCLAGETCVLDHCLLRDRVSCRGASDCNSERGEKCIIEADAHDELPPQRGNEQLFTKCMPMDVALEQVATTEPEAAEDRSLRVSPRARAIVDLAENFE